MYVVIFRSKLRLEESGYGEEADKIAARVQAMPGFIRMQSVHDKDNNGITVCYWDSLEAIQAWRGDLVHQHAQEQGKLQWYEYYHISVAKVEYEYSWGE